jgi:hypothetical protein
MPDRPRQQGRQVVLAVLVLVAFLGVIVMGGAMAIGELRPADRPGAWSWFWIGWLLVTIAAGGTVVPQWRAGTLIRPAPASRPPTWPGSSAWPPSVGRSACSAAPSAFSAPASGSPWALLAVVS